MMWLFVYVILFLFLYLAQIEKTLLQPDKGFEFLINK